MMLRNPSIPLPFNVKWESPETFWVEFCGLITFADIVNASERLYNDVRCDRVKYAFWDFSSVNDFVLSKSNLVELAAMDFVASRYMRLIKVAFIIRDASLRELLEYYVATLGDMGCPWQSKLLGSPDDARQWIAG